MLSEKGIEAGVSLELGGIIYRLAKKYELSIEDTAKRVYLSSAYEKLSKHESLLYKEDLLRLLSIFEETMIEEKLLSHS
jgi:hypothetical protein